MSTELAKRTENTVVSMEDYAIAQMDRGDLMDALQENLGGGEIGPFDLERANVPTGGMTQFMLPSLENPNGEMSPEITGVIISHRKMRAYWHNQDAAQTGTPPDCASDGGEEGTGNPGGKCAACPFNEFGSSPKGTKQGKACKESRLIYILRPSGFLPLAVSCPPTSLKPLKKYLLKLTGAGVPYHKAVTRIALKQAQNSNGTVYAEMEFSCIGRVEPTAHDAIIAPYRQTIQGALEQAAQYYAHTGE